MFGCGISGNSDELFIKSLASLMHRLPDSTFDKEGGRGVISDPPVLAVLK